VLEVAHVGKRGRLVDDRVRIRLDDRLHHGLPIEQIEHDRLSPERAQMLSLVR
jgi:hypothetical protein